MSSYDSVIFFVFIFDDAQSFGHRFDRVDDFFLHQIKTHGQQSNAEQQIQRTQGDAHFYVLLDVLGRHEVTVSTQSQNRKKIDDVRQFRHLPPKNQCTNLTVSIPDIPLFKAIKQKQVS